MTGDNIRANVADEMRLAASALLFSLGLEVTSHRAVRTLLSRHFVQTGRLDAELSKELGQLESLRTAGDYDSAFAMGVAEIRPELTKAQRIVERAETLLRANVVPAASAAT